MIVCSRNLAFKIAIFSTGLSRGSDPFPCTEVAEHPAGQKTQNQLPSHAAQLLNAHRHAQHSSSEERKHLGVKWENALLNLNRNIFKRQRPDPIYHS